MYPLKSSLLKLCRQFIRINSTNPSGTLKLAEFAGRELQKLGFRVRCQKALFCGARQANLTATIGPKKGRPLLINTHLDTVETNRNAWTQTGRNPFQPTVKGEYLYGLGSADTKLALACQIEALKKMDLKRLKRRLVITGTFAEEMGMAGVRRLIESKEIKNIGCVLNSEPTGLEPVIGNHGFRVYRLDITLSPQGRGELEEVYFRGKAAHSAKPWMGKNAIVDCLKWLERMRDEVSVVEMEGGLEANIVAPFCRAKVKSPPTPLLSPPPFIPPPLGGTTPCRHGMGGRGEGPITGGERGDFARLAECVLKFLSLSGKDGQTHNLGVIKFKRNRLMIKIDHRFGPGIDPKRREKELRRCFPSTSGVATASGVATCVIHLERDNPAFCQSSKSRLVGEVKAVLKSMGKRSHLLTRPGCTEAGYLAKIADEVITIGPGASYGNAHQPNERVSMRQLEDAVTFYRRIIEKLCF